jgi:hypothetical protein
MDENKKLFDKVDILKLQLLDPCPNFEQAIVRWLPNNFLDNLLEMLRNDVFQPFFYFLKGILYEYGIFYDKNLEKAKYLYLEGTKLKEPYCFYKLYYITRDNKEKEGDLDQCFLYLTKGALYFDIDEDERFFFNPYSTLKYLFEKEIVQKEQILQLIQKNKNKSEEDCEYLENIFQYIFHENLENKKEILTNIVKLAKKDHMESDYFIGRQLYLKDENKDALTYLEKCINKNLIKSICLYSCIQYENKLTEKSLYYAKIGSDYGDCKCLDFYGNMLVDEITFNRVNYSESFDTFLKQTLYGDILGLDNAVFVLLKLLRKEKKNYKNEFTKYSKILFELSEAVYKYSDNCVKNGKRIMFNLLFGEQYYLLAYFFYKGVHVKKNHKHALDILLESENDETLKSRRMINYILAKLFDKAKNEEKACEYYLKYFDALEKIDEKSPKHYYYLAKFLYNNKYVEKNIGRASYYIEQGIKFKFEFSYSLDIYYYKKCLNFREVISNEYQNMIKEIKLNKIDNFLCNLCCEKPKEAVFVPCGHKYCCYECGMKIIDTINVCPVCKKTTTYLLSKIFE